VARKRKGKGYPRPAALAVLGPDPAAVRLHEAARDCQPEPGAAARVRARLVLAPEPVEHPLRRVRGEPIAAVFDRDDHMVGIRLDDDRDLAVGRRVAHRVREQVHENALDLVRRDPHDRVGRSDPRLELDLARASLRAERVQAARDELAERGVSHLQRERAGVDPGQLEEIFDEA
jgi:hypothetical protein